MKKLCALLFVVVVLCFGLCSCGTDPSTQIVGSWVGEYGGAEMRLDFESDNTGMSYTNGTSSASLEWSYIEDEGKYDVEYSSTDTNKTYIGTASIVEEDGVETLYYDNGDWVFEYTRME